MEGSPERQRQACATQTFRQIDGDGRPMRDIQAIRELLDRDPVSFAIVAYLSRHTQAMDTARGIAEWWIHMELRPTQEALANLFDLGVLCCQSAGPATIYCYTRDPKLQGWLLRYVKNQDRERTDIARW